MIAATQPGCASSNGRGLLVDIGCTPWSGLLSAAVDDCPAHVTDVLTGAVTLTPDVQISLGSDFVRAGPVYSRSADVDHAVHDLVGAEWSRDAECPSPFFHPLAEADLASIRAYRAPDMPMGLQAPDPVHHSIVVDAAVPGLIEICCALRGSWQFLLDCVDETPEAEALLDWAEVFLCHRFTEILSNCPQHQVVVYRDSLGNETGPYCSPREFERLVIPRLRNVVRAIRNRSAEPLAACVRGGGRHLLASLVDEGFSIIGIDCNARGMTIDAVRQVVGRHAILHGPADLLALGRSLECGDRKGIATLACEFSSAMPAIAAANMPIGSVADRLALSHGAAFIAALTPDDLEALASVGPARTIIEEAAKRASLRISRTVLPYRDATPACSALQSGSVHTA